MLVPSEEFKSAAGARIRYKRMQHPLASVGVELSVQSIDEFNPMNAECEAVLISKCHDARSLVAAAVVGESGKLVGVDLFDDYFSNDADSRLVRYREWLAQIVTLCDFVVSSTSTMAEIAESYGDQLPRHVMNDPAPEQDPAVVTSIADRKHKDLQATRRLRVLWFGVGDNPYYDVGLSDLAAFGSDLGALAAEGIDIELTVLTNARALTSRGLGLIARLPVAAKIREWSEALEAQLLADAHLVFLPLSSQPFNRAKSLNRAVTAMSAGCQVLSVGYPLYATLEPLIYRDAQTYLNDLWGSNFKLSSLSLDTYRNKLAAVASAPNEAARLVKFLRGLDASPKTTSPLVVIHGSSTRLENHQAVKAVGGLSVASPYCNAGFDFDIVFRGLQNEMRMIVLDDKLENKIKGSKRVGKREEFSRLSANARMIDQVPSLALNLVTYDKTMQAIALNLAESFGPCRILLSETSPLPFRAFNKTGC